MMRSLIFAKGVNVSFFFFFIFARYNIDCVYFGAVLSCTRNLCFEQKLRENRELSLLQPSKFAVYCMCVLSY